VEWLTREKMTSLQTIDDRDPSVVYSAGQWGQTGTSDSTITLTNKQGAVAKILFHGTRYSTYTSVERGVNP